MINKITNHIQGSDIPSLLSCWLQDVQILEDGQGKIVFQCPNEFAKRRIQDKFQTTLSRLVLEACGQDFALCFQVLPESTLIWDAGVSGPEVSLPELSKPKENVPPRGSRAPVAESKDAVQLELFPGYNPRFQFSQFVVGTSNRLAWSAACEVANTYHASYNPLLVSAPTGLGKTHLGQAIGEKFCMNHPGGRVRYATAERFLTDMIRHMKSKSVDSFKKKYREDCDLLILDDLSFARGKSSLQSELCFTLDTLINSRKQVVLLQCPGTEPALDDSLKSRAFSGLHVSMESPDFDTRLEILTRLAHGNDADFSMETLESLARQVNSNVRDIEGSFKKLLAIQLLTGELIDPESVASHLRGLPFARFTELNPQAIRQKVANYFKMDPEKMGSKSRIRRVLLPRQIAMYLSRKHTSGTLEEIGALYRRDHSAVLYAVESLEKKIMRNAVLRKEVLFIEEKLLKS